MCVRICACVCLIERLEEREKEFSFLVFSLGHLFDRNLWTIKLMATLSNILVYFGLKCIEPQNENSKKCFEDVHLSLKTCYLSYVKLRSKKSYLKIVSGRYYLENNGIKLFLNNFIESFELSLFITYTNNYSKLTQSKISKSKLKQQKKFQQ